MSDVDHVGAFQAAMGPEPANREGSQPAVFEQGAFQHTRVRRHALPSNGGQHLNADSPSLQPVHEQPGGASSLRRIGTPRQDQEFELALP